MNDEKKDFNKKKDINLTLPSCGNSDAYHISNKLIKDIKRNFFKEWLSEQIRKDKQVRG